MTVILELVGHPFSVSYIVLVAWIWVNVAVEEFDCKPFLLSYTDCVLKRQYWRLLTSPFMHKSFIHLFFNLVMLWSVRWIEDEYGSWFMFRYTLLLHFCEGLFAFLFIQYGIKVARNELFTQYLSNIQSLGCSGVVVAWLTFMSTHLRTAPIIFLGVLPLHASYVLFPTIVLNYLLTPLTNVYANLSGLLSGYMLAAGMLTLLPTTYLTMCILGNIVILTFSSYYQHIQNPDGAVATTSGMLDEERGMIEVRLLGDSSDDPVATTRPAIRDQPIPSSSVSTFADTLRQRWGTWFRPRGEGARGGGVEEETPLLQDDNA